MLCISLYSNCDAKKTSRNLILPKKELVQDLQILFKRIKIVRYSECSELFFRIMDEDEIKHSWTFFDNKNEGIR